MKMCPSCTQVLYLSHFVKDKTRSDGYARSCKSCMKAYRLRWLSTKTEQDRDIMRQEVRSWHKNNPDRKLMLDRSYRKTSQYKEAQNTYLSQWRRNNKATVNAIQAARRAVKKQAVPPWYEREQIKLLYDKTAKLSKTLNVPLHVDHIIPLVNDTVCGLHCWHNLQVLDKTLNLHKTNTYQRDW